MLQTCLSGVSSRPCLLLRVRGVSILLDCGLDATQTTHFLPVSPVQQPHNRIQQMTNYAAKDGHDLGIEGVRKEGEGSIEGVV